MVMDLDPTLLITLGLAALFLAMGLVGYVGFAAAVQRRSVNRSLRTMSTSELHGATCASASWPCPSCGGSCCPA
jgi:hypothetical protein